jgi:hypothetical protein
MRIPALSIFAVIILTGCCISNSTSVRNETGKDILLTTVNQAKQTETVMIRAKATGRCSGVWPALPDQPPESWAISDGKSRFTFADVSIIATLPDQFVSSSRFTRDFPCNRITRHVRIAPDMTIHAVRVIGYTEWEPPSFPIHYTKKEVDK